MDEISISMLGGFHLRVNGEMMDAPLTRSPKGRMLLQYLLLRDGELVTAAEMARLLALASVSALKTLVSRTRDLLATIHPALASCVATGSGGYFWHPNPLVHVDIVDFHRQASHLYDCDELTDATRAQFNSAIALYRGDLLGDLAQEEWLSGRSASLQAMYIALVQRYLNLLQAEDNWTEMIRVCREALTMLPFNEALHLRLSEIMLRTSRSGDASAARNYQAQLLRTGKTLDEGIAQLRSTLVRPHNRQAIICDSTMLREVCELTMRNLDRTGLSLFLGLFIITSPEEQLINPLRLDVIAESLVQHFASGLRRGDVVCRTDDAQVAVLLPTMSEASARIALERISRNYLADAQQNEFILTYRLTKLEA